MSPKPAEKSVDDVPDLAEDTDLKKKRKFKRKTLFDRNYKKLNKNKTRRVAVTSSRIGRMFKAQTARLLAGMEEDPTIYARDLHAVQRLSKGASELTSNVVEKLMCNIFATLHRTSRHAKRKTVKLEDFQLYLDCLEA